MDRNRVTAGLVTIGWLLLNLHWISSDRLVRDGDEEGHVGAAELFKDIVIEQGWLTWLIEAWQGDFGEYPPLFAAVVGAWWSIVDVAPSHVAIRGLLLLSVVISALAISRITSILNRKWLLPYVFVLCLPLFNGVARHFMPEALMTTLSCLSLLFLLRARENRKWRDGFLAGVFIGLGLLTKQSFVLIATAPLFVLWLGCIPSIQLISATVTLLIALPWFAGQMQTQQEYLWRSILGNSEALASAELFFYPSSILLLGWGLMGSALVLWASFLPQRKERWQWAWILLGLIVLILLPKKYPRLLLAWIPVGALFLPALEERISATTSRILAFSMLLSLGIYSHLESPENPFQPLIEENCPQIWVRPPSTVDLHYQRIAELVTTAPDGHIAVLHNPEIPCSIQSTHNWAYHLDPYLRRRGLHRDILLLDKKNIDWRSASVQIEWLNKNIKSSSSIQISTQER